MNFRLKLSAIFIITLFFFQNLSVSAQRNKTIEGIKLTHFRLFESGKEIPEIGKRVYNTSFYQFTCRYIYAEVYVKNLRFNIEDQVHKVLWKWNSVDKRSNIKGKTEAEFNIKKEWEFAYISRGWGFPNTGSWPVGKYIAEVFIDKIKAGEVEFEIVDTRASSGNTQDADENVQLVNQIMKSTNEGHISMGKAFLYGNGVEQDYGAARSLFTTAFNQGSRLAAYYLGIIHYYGYGVPQDYEMAFKWFSQSPDTLAEAHYYLGYMYLYGQYLPVNYKEADRFLKYAAEHGITDAQATLGISYMLQASDPKNYLFDGYPKSYYWLYIAAAQNNENGLKFYDVVKDMVTEDDKKKLEKDAITFLNNPKNLDYSYLHQAVVEKDLPKVKQLLAYGVDVNIRENANNMTPLHFAMAMGNYDITKYLLDYGAYVNAVSAAGFSPLMLLVINMDDITTTELLLGYGALPNLIDKNNKTALDYAIENKKNELAGILKRYEAKTAKELKTPLCGIPVLFEPFDNDSKGWSNSPDWEYYGTWFENGSYCIEEHSESCALEDIALPGEMPANFSVELSCTWKDGIKNDFFGLVLGAGRSSYYAFGLCASGWATIKHRTDSTNMETVFEWKKNLAIASDGKSVNIIRIEVKKGQATYILNNHVIEAVKLDIEKPKIVGVRVCGLQKVFFDELKICKLDD